jgi:Protein of unknown function (DUF3108)
LAVLMVHTLALRGQPFAVRPAASSAPVQPLNTRVIAAAPVAAPPSLPTATPSPQPAAPRKMRSPPNQPSKIESKAPVAQAERAQAAPETIATADPVAPPPGPIEMPAELPQGTSQTPHGAEAAAPAPPSGLQATPVTALALPPSVELSYRMTGSAGGLNYQASAQLDWNNAGSSYDSRISVSAFLLGSRSLVSRGQIDAGGLAPLRFADSSRKRELAVHFEAEKKSITFSSNAPPALWIPGAQDRLSVFMQLAGMLAGNPSAFPLGSTISVYTAGPRSAELWTFLVEAEELLQVPLGEQAAIKLTSQLRNDHDRTLEIWYVPAWGYVPARFRYTQANQDFIDQQLRAIKPL